jgi:adenosylcobinamide kinase/adenosylcobinamide-phosphate guanylyltransferase
VLVSNEVGMGVVPPTASGRLFQDLLGGVNARVSAACDRTTLIVAGQPIAMRERRREGT